MCKAIIYGDQKKTKKVESILKLNEKVKTLIIYK